jgi:maleamate amidohydrolase
MRETGIIGFGARPALLIVDFVNGFLYGPQPAEATIPGAVRRTRPLLDAARASGVPVIHTRIVYAEDGSDASLWLLKSPRLASLTETAEASQITASLNPISGEKIVRKTQPSAFFGTDLAGHLVRHGVDTLVVAGCTTSGCIRATVVDAISHNFRPMLAVDCLGDRCADQHDTALHEMGQKYADLMPSQAVMAKFDRLMAAS